MDLNKIFPFYQESKVIRRYKSDVDLTSDRYLASNNSHLIPDENMEDLISRSGINTSRRVPLVRLLPNDLIFYCGNNEY